MAEASVGVSTRFSFPEYKSPAMSADLTAWTSIEFSAEIATDEALKNACGMPSDVAMQVRNLLSTVKQAFDSNSKLLCQHKPVKWHTHRTVKFCRDGQVYLDMGQSLKKSLEKTVAKMIDLIKARFVIVLIPSPNELSSKRWTHHCSVALSLQSSEHFARMLGLIPLSTHLPAHGQPIEFSIVQEFYPTDYCTWRKQRLLIDEAIKHKHFIQAAQAVNVLHEQRSAHRDIKPDNFLVDEEGNLKLTDLSSVAMDGSPEFTRFPGTAGYFSPEVWRLYEPLFMQTEQKKQNCRIGQPVEIAFYQQAEIWALGLMFFAIEVGGIPLVVNTITDAKTHTEIWESARAIRLSGINRTFTTSIEKMLKQNEGESSVRIKIIQDCLNPDPSKRPTIQQILDRLIPKNNSAASVASIENSVTIDVA